MTRKIKYKEPSQNLTKMAAPNIGSSQRSSVGMDKFIGEYYYINVDKLIPHKNQARHNFDEKELQNLAETIKEHGIRQPLSVSKTDQDEDKYEVISGERRLRAAKMAGLEKVPCIILSSTDKKEEIALIENIQRSDLHPIELARGLKKLIDSYGWGGQTDIEKRIGIPQSRVSECLKMLELPIEIQDLCIAQNYTGRDNLLNLLKIDGDKKRENTIMGVFNSGQQLPKKFSVIRVLCEEGTFRIQKNSIKKLSAEQKEELREELKKILGELEKQM